MDGTIFDIKEFSIHDGRGARITVFLKGCPLRCVWCHNPEGLSTKRQIVHKKTLCTNCGLCKQGCSHEDCRGFERCIHICPNGCNSIAGEIISSEELAERLRANEEILSLLSGGITISGGEPMLQSDFVIDLTERLDGIHKAIETSGYAEPDVYRRVIENFDYVMQDIKLVDEKLHKKYTGVSNSKILKNIEYLKECGKEFLFRVPLIPGITDTNENLEAIRKFTDGYPVEYLKYNSLAGAKYEMLGMKYNL